MYKVTIDELKQVKKSLINSNKYLDNLPASCGSFEKEEREKAVKQNNKSIELIDGYLNPKED